jgi:hypothetical protein
MLRFFDLAPGEQIVGPSVSVIDADPQDDVLSAPINATREATYHLSLFLAFLDLSVRFLHEESSRGISNVCPFHRQKSRLPVCSSCRPCRSLATGSSAYISSASQHTSCRACMLPSPLLPERDNLSAFILVSLACIKAPHWIVPLILPLADGAVTAA